MKKLVVETISFQLGNRPMIIGRFPNWNEIVSTTSFFMIRQEKSLRDCFAKFDANGDGKIQALFRIRFSFRQCISMNINVYFVIII